jgi:glycosyltransferase involved in cell wall biosynthesis
MLVNLHRNRLVLFDYMDAIHRDPYFRHVIRYVDVILVDNEARRRQVKSLQLNKPIELWEDPIDYGLDKAMPATGSGKVAWFGNYPNVRSVDWQIEALQQARQDFFVITDCARVKQYTRCACIQWHLNNFVKTLRTAGCTVLSHQGDNLKSHNKLTVSIAAGVPVIVGESQSYEPFLRKFKLDWAICRDEASLLQAVRRLRSKAQQQEYLDSGIQQYVLENYNRDQTAKRLLDIIVEHR